ncbi:hypothetical protein ACOZ4N_12715 [Halorientalis pallida]|uniref:hypothetical protein n=1 Tax=Halorientalis pallida TaxID=2479928 RepID=UPI003C6F5FBC
MSESKYDNVQITYRHDTEYWENVDQNNPNSWTQVSISVDSEQVYGRDNGGVTGRACTTTLELLESVEAINRGERYIVEFEFGPSWLTAEPDGEQTIKIVRCATFKAAKDPDERLNIDRAYTVPKDAWENEVVRVARDFVKEVQNRNPELADNESICAIRSKVDEIDHRES